MRDEAACPVRRRRAMVPRMVRRHARQPGGVLAVLAVLPCLTGCLPGFGRQPDRLDALDKVTGTESWRVRRESLDEEWRDWYRARVARRREYRELRVERVRNIRVRRLLERYPDGPSIHEVLPVIRSRAMHLPGRSPATSDESGDGDWARVPVQRLDRSLGGDGDAGGSSPPDGDPGTR